MQRDDLGRGACVAALTLLALRDMDDAERGACLGVLEQHLPSLRLDEDRDLRRACLALLNAATARARRLARRDAADALVPVLRAQTCALLVRLSVKRVA
jgi:hypothetical protein